MVQVAGHFRETQVSAVGEAVLKIVVSVVMVFRFGLVGVTIGSLVAMSFRVFYLVWYLSVNILHEKIGSFVKHLMTDAAVFLLLLFLTRGMSLTSLNWSGWIILAIKVGVVAVSLSIAVNALVYRTEIKDIWVYFIKDRKERKQK